MAAVNSLLFLLTTIAPYTQPPENPPVTYLPAAWKSHSFSRDDVPDLTNTTEDENMCFTPWIYKGDFCHGPHEHYERCGFICPEACCPYECPINCCVEGCFCDNGFVRGPIGTCITDEECPPTCDHYMEKSAPDILPNDTLPIDLFPDIECPKNEWYTCSAHCQRKCEKSWWPCPGWCVPGCECMWPLVRAPDGKCVFPDQCPNHLAAMTQDKEDCEPDQEMSCYSHCEKNCTNYEQEIPCPIYCVRGCVCKEPRIRGPDGSCILPEYCPNSELLLQEKQCLETPEGCAKSQKEVNPKSPTASLGQFPSCLGENEELRICSPRCPDDCDNYQDKTRVCKLVCLPIPKCECRSGFVRGPDGKCIKPEQCPIHEGKPGNCPETETYETCGPACEIQCFSLHRPDEVCSDKNCVAGCFCKPGYVRGFNGHCIRPVECWLLALQTDNPTSSSPSTPPYDVPEVTLDKKIGDEYETGKDSGEYICPKNEEYIFCGTACPKNCSNYDKDTPCSRICVAGCYCKDPMLRGPDGQCIHIQECPETANKLQSLYISCPVNEEYNHCGTSCPKTCDDPVEDVLCRSNCVSGCFCKDPMVRGPDGKCIPKEECSDTRSSSAAEPYFIRNYLFHALFQCDENAEFSFCTNLCPDNCNNYETDRLCKHMCVPGCKCNHGYVFGDGGSCIKKEDCGEQTSNNCTDLEYYDECGPQCEEDCVSYNNVIAFCKSRECRRGCFCKPGFVRSLNWKCVLSQVCTTALSLTGVQDL